jgi:hypothetical protein
VNILSLTPDPVEMFIPSTPIFAGHNYHCEYENGFPKGSAFITDFEWINKKHFHGLVTSHADTFRALHLLYDDYSSHNTQKL